VLDARDRLLVGAGLRGLGLGYPALAGHAGTHGAHRHVAGAAHQPPALADRDGRQPLGAAVVERCVAAHQDRPGVLAGVLDGPRGLVDVGGNDAFQYAGATAAVRAG